MTKARDIASAAPAPSTVSATEIGYLDGVTSAIQTQIDSKQAANANVSTTELGYLDGVTSAIQTQLDGKTAKSTLTTTGDIYYASSANTPARLGIGSTDQVLKVSGGVPVWATPSSGAMTKIVSTQFTAVANQDFLNCFSSTYDSYFIEFSRMYDSGATATPTVKFNWFYDTNTDIGNGRYYGGTMYVSTTGVATTGQSTNGAAFWSFGRTDGAGLTTGGFLNISSAGSKGGSGNEYTNFNAEGMWMESGGTGSYRTWIGGASHTGNFAITGFRISLSGGNISGRVTVYGLEK